ncbi:hypothetical protein K491DRAFT_699561 [Lophiostoma macrostomum CBS 122681]|uniref:Uncharacterized protein n=1 Tax=Lophiostoma macrostomum CBS 122681 TaxID=1314788 RepID=A0A6A6SN03_9PLEO|nr:hypothetical protein K491DRAFT_699561 [Lophiostoma macrostomum CBS 122681]
MVVTYGLRGREDGKIELGTNTNRDYRTSVEAINAEGDVIPLMLILKAKQHLY